MKAIKYVKIAFMAVAGFAILYTSVRAFTDVIASMSDTSTSTSVSAEVSEENAEVSEENAEVSEVNEG